MRGSLKVWQLLVLDNQGKFQPAADRLADLKVSTGWEVLRCFLIPFDPPERLNQPRASNSNVF
jgi:hypothetical protein